MAIEFDPKVKGVIARDVLTDAAATDRQSKHSQRVSLPAMDKPAELATPDRAKDLISRPPHPAEGARAHSRLEKQVARLRQALAKGDAAASKAAAQALSMCASYTMRRSRGARRMAVDLCEEISESVAGEDHALMARQMRHVLLAEAYLYENDGEATLRACRALVAMLDSDGP